MNGFVILAYSHSIKDEISTIALENDIKKRNMYFKKSFLNNLTFENIICYQFLKENNNIDEINSNYLIAGDIYGLISADNRKLLNYKEVIKLLNSTDFANDYVALEGNACISQILEDKIIIQNGLDGYRRLFYYINKNIFIITTLLPFIFKAVNNEWTIRRNAINNFIFDRESRWPLTFIEDIYSLPPLSRAEVTKTGIHIASKTYSDFYQLNHISKEELREKLYNQYSLIARRKVSSNTAVPLSGGFDSNCLTKLYSNIFKNNFTAISVGYKAERYRDMNIYDETVFAEKIAKKLKIPYKRYFFTRTEFFNNLNEFIDIIDQPGHDPSSNFIMNKYLHDDGFELVVNGMGGDANFATNINKILGLKLVQISKFTGINIIKLVGRILKYRGPFRYYRLIRHNERIFSFPTLFERAQTFIPSLNNYITTSKQIEIYNEKSIRENYFSQVYNKSLTKQEFFYSLGLFSSPAEYHAQIMAERNNLEILMPFVDIKAVLLVMNGSYFNKSITSREFEISIFGGIDTGLLAKSKSGFSIPYSEWLYPIAQTIFDFYNDLNYFDVNDFNLDLFKSKYSTDRKFSMSNTANKVLWKLLLVKEYSNKHNLKL